MDTVTAGAIGRRELAGAQRQTMETILERWNFAQRQTNPIVHSRIAVTTPAGLTGDIRRGHR